MKLRDAIDQDKFIIDNKTFTDDDLQAMNMDCLETLKMQINKKINGLSTSIKERQIEYARGGKSAPTEWYMKRKHAQSINQRVLTYVNSLIKKRLRSEKSIGDYFMDTAKDVLSQRDFERILTDAQSEKEARETSADKEPQR